MRALYKITIDEKKIQKAGATKNLTKLQKIVIKWIVIYVIILIILEIINLLYSIIMLLLFSIFFPFIIIFSKSSTNIFSI